jgi:hypothetical protein
MGVMVLQVFFAVSVYTITGGFWGIGFVLQFALGRLLPEGFIRGFRAAAPVQQVRCCTIFSVTGWLHISSLVVTVVMDLLGSDDMNFAGMNCCMYVCTLKFSMVLLW